MTQTESTNWRALCAELLDVIDFLCEGDTRPDSELVTRARAALAQPAPEGPTDEELLELWQGWNLGWDPQKGIVLMPHPAEYARAFLARFGAQR